MYLPPCCAKRWAGAHRCLYYPTLYLGLAKPALKCRVTLPLLPDIVRVRHHVLHAASPLQVAETCSEKRLSQPTNPTNKTHLQRERKKVCHKNQDHATRLGWLLYVACKKAIIFLKSKKSAGQTPKPPAPKKPQNNKPQQPSLRKHLHLPLVCRYDASIEGHRAGDFGKRTHPLAKLYINLWEGLNLRAAWQTVVLHGRKSPAFKRNLYNHLLSLCFLEDYEWTSLLASSQPLCNLMLFRCACCFVLFPACTEAKICLPYPGNCWTGKWKSGRAASRKIAHTIFR